jgi:hypothetical protein
MIKTYFYFRDPFFLCAPPVYSSWTVFPLKHNNITFFSPFNLVEKHCMFNNIFQTKFIPVLKWEPRHESVWEHGSISPLLNSEANISCCLLQISSIQISAQRKATRILTFSWVFSVKPGKCWDSPSNWATTSLRIPSSSVYAYIDHHNAWRYGVRYWQCP